MAGKQEKPKAPKCVKASYVSFPSKNVVVKLMDDGSIHFDCPSTKFAAMNLAHSLDKEAKQISDKDAVLAIGMTCIDTPKK